MNRYIFRQLIIGTIVVSVGLLCIVWLTQSLRFVEMILSRGLSVGTFLHLTGLLLPNFLLIIMPVALFAVVLFTYNRLNGDRELVVMRAAGVSPVGLARPALLLAGAMTVAGAIMANFWVPDTVRAFREMQWSIRHDVSNVMLQEGAFNSPGPGITIYIRAREGTGELSGILIHQAGTDQAEPVTTVAQRGAMLRGENDETRLLLVNGNRHWVDADTGQLSLLYFDSYTLTLRENEGPGEIRIGDPRELTFRELNHALENRSTMTPAEQRRFRLEAHQRLINPVSNMTFALIALATILTGSFDRRGIGRRLLVGIVVMAASQSAMVGAANLANNNSAFLALVHLTVIVPLIAAGAVLLRATAGGGFGLRKTGAEAKAA